MCTPVTDLHTKLFAVVTFRTRLPARWLKYAIEPFAMRIFRQDARILEQQTESIRRFGGEQFVSSELDLMGPKRLAFAQASRDRGQSPRTPSRS
jgi:hypothetical protein